MRRALALVGACLTTLLLVAPTAQATPAVAGVSRVAGVYTPPAWRGRGYAGAVTAAATRAAYAAGARHVCLFTDAANPTANGVYERLGYRRHPVDRLSLALATV